MKLVIEIELGNDAMQTAADAADALTQALIQQSDSPIDPLLRGDGGRIYDGNGNTVGSWVVASQ